jgi:hypothetical protein
MILFGTGASSSDLNVFCTGRLVAKYKKKKATADHIPASTTPSKVETATLSQTKGVDSSDKKPRRLASGSLKLQFAGDLILVKNSQKSLSGLFKRYAALFEALANMPKEQRGLVYKIMTGLMLTSHAKKATNAESRRGLFDMKNNLFVAIANDRFLRRQVEFKYLGSKNFRVLQYCDTCQKTNAELGIDRHKWKYCKQCNVDHNFYNLLSMEIKFPQGFARMFISNDQIAKLEHFRLPRKIILDHYKEEAIIDQFHYNTRNLDAIELDSVIALHHKLLTAPAPLPAGSSMSNLKRPVKKPTITPAQS